jgi:hypothetical protein
LTSARAPCAEGRTKKFTTVKMANAAQGTVTAAAPTPQRIRRRRRACFFFFFRVAVRLESESRPATAVTLVRSRATVKVSSSGDGAVTPAVPGSGWVFREPLPFPRRMIAVALSHGASAVPTSAGVA